MQFPNLFAQFSRLRAMARHCRGRTCPCEIGQCQLDEAIVAARLAYGQIVQQVMKDPQAAPRLLGVDTDQAETDPFVPAMPDHRLGPEDDSSK